jgi:hypothetical protein
MGHVTLAGISHHGLRNFEVWLQSMAPGVATPVHSHPPGCEEINFVLEVRAPLSCRTPGCRCTLSLSPPLAHPRPGDRTPQGTGLVRTRGRDGSVTEHAVGANDTMIAPPGTVWQVENTHRRKDLRVLVVIGCGRPGISFFSTWNDTSPTLLPVMPWNQQCPPPLPAAALRQVQ